MAMREQIICFKLICIKVELEIWNDFPISVSHFYACVVKITRILWELQVIHAEDISLSESELFDGVIGLKKTYEKNLFLLFSFRHRSINLEISIDESH